MVRKLIWDKMTEKGMKMKELSLRLGHAHSYMYQFLMLGIPLELKEGDRMKLSEILGVPENELRGPSTKLQKRNYEKKMATTESLLANHSPTQIGLHIREQSPARITASADLYGDADLPVYGTARSDRVGALIVSETVVDYVARPLPLRRVKDAYGIIVNTEMMSPEHKMGSIALVNPHLPPRIGDSCVFRTVMDHDATAKLAIIKEYRGQTETHWKVHQHNPPKDLLLKISDWPTCQRIVGNYVA